MDTQDHENHHSLEIQLRNLGLVLANLPAGMKTLDIACGRDPILVGALREKGVNAEGLDIKAPNMPFYMRQAIALDNPIPRPNDHYDLITCHQHPFLNSEYSCFGDTIFFSIHGVHDEREQQQAKATILEAVRVIKPEGRIVIYPGLDTIEKLEKELNRLRVKRQLEKVKEIDPNTAYILDGHRLESTASSFCFRTILTKSA